MDVNTADGVTALLESRERDGWGPVCLARLGEQLSMGRLLADIMIMTKTDGKVGPMAFMIIMRIGEGQFKN